jgi:hypothetical protein
MEQPDVHVVSGGEKMMKQESEFRIQEPGGTRLRGIFFNLQLLGSWLRELL